MNLQNENMRIILIAFSGGRTSAYMTFWLLRVYYKCKWDEIEQMHIGTDENGNKVGLIVCFANTSKEKDETLEFVKLCDVNFGFKTVWLEGVWNMQRGKGTRHRIVDFYSAKRDGSVYRDMIKKHGIPNVVNPICTREMKTYVIKAYLRYERDLKPKEYETAIGYRVDEPKRFNTPKKRLKQIRERQLYPLADVKPTTKAQILGWWKLQPFDLQIEDHEGNCTECYKKSEKKLIAIKGCQIKSGKVDTWYEDIETEFGGFIPEGRKKNTKIKLPMTFYRQYTTSKQIREKAEIYFADANTPNEVEIYKQALLNAYDPKQESICATESCEPF